MDNLQKLVNRTKEILEGQELAVQWIETPNRALSGKAYRPSFNDKMGLPSHQNYFLVILVGDRLL